MKHVKTLSLLILALTLNAQAEDFLKDFDTLGGNKVLLEKAKALNPQTEVAVVQDRIVSRRNRFEIAQDSSFVVGGDPYISSRNLGLTAHYHITPRWSLGIRYNNTYNNLKDEAQYLINSEGPGIVPDIDYPISQQMAMLNWYPIYGKMNVYDLGIAHFDIYTTLAYGSIKLRSGSKTTYSAGGGVGLWVSNHFAVRIELRWQGYPALRSEQDTYMNTTVTGLQLGWLI